MMARQKYLMVILIGSALWFEKASADDRVQIARQAQAVLQQHCYRCHGRDGSVEGGMNYVIDRRRLIARHKIVPGKPNESPLFLKVSGGKMPPPGETPRPGKEDIEVLRRWIAAGAPSPDSDRKRRFISETELYEMILADLEHLPRRSRRFARYFTFTHLANAGATADELRTYRQALAKLINSLSWHPNVTVPRPIDPSATVFRIDLRDFLWDALLWNRILAEYPYGVASEATVARAVYVATASRMPVIRGDWFLATASRAPLYYDILQLPTNVSELERELRIDVAVNVAQERVARAGFNGSAVSRNNRLIERHVSVHGAYWKSYDFESIPQPASDRQNLLPDRRNLFAYPLGPGGLENMFQHAGSEIIFNLPNGLQGYLLANADGIRIDKAPTQIVSDPRRPDRAVEAGLSCIGCHVTGILPKDDQVRSYVTRHANAFEPEEVERILALYVPRPRMRRLMQADSRRFLRAVKRTGCRTSGTEPVLAMASRYEEEIDLIQAAAECGLQSDEFTSLISSSSSLGRTLGSLTVPGGTVKREVMVQAFGDVVAELGRGQLVQPFFGETLPDNTGEIDPFEGQSELANAIAFSPDARRALFASADKSVRVWDTERQIEVQRLIGHTASVWAVAWSHDGQRALSAGADRTVRWWDVETGRELRQFKGHRGLVTCATISPDNRYAITGGYDHRVAVWDVGSGKAVRWLKGTPRYVNCVACSPNGRWVLVGGRGGLMEFDLRRGKRRQQWLTDAPAVTVAVYSPDGATIAAATDDGKVYLISREGSSRQLSGHRGPVKSLAFSPTGRLLLSGAADQQVLVWDVPRAKVLHRFRRHRTAVVGVTFTSDEHYLLAGDRDSVIRWWKLPIEPDKDGE